MAFLPLLSGQALAAGVMCETGGEDFISVTNWGGVPLALPVSFSKRMHTLTSHWQSQWHTNVKL